MIRKGFIVIGVIFIAILLVNYIYPLKKLELVILDQIYMKGQGFDDAVQIHIISNKDRYSKTIYKMLHSAKPDSFDERLALKFVEFVKDCDGIEEALRDMMERHPNVNTKSLIASILNHRVKYAPIHEGGNYVVEEMRLENQEKP